jgi:propanol-preferring alcohol dehydrogenase
LPTMKAAVLKEIGKPLVIEDVPIPEIGYGEVLVRTKACGICATDLHIVEGTGYKPKLPRVLGHEPSGVVEKVGPGVDSLKPGDRVVPNIFFTCGRCFYCRTNMATHCENFPGALGIGLDGGYAEFFKAPATNLFILPENVDFAKGAVIADAVVTAVHAVRRRAKVTDSDTVLVLGTGGVGQSVIQLAKHAGATVLAVVRQKARGDIASKIGADFIINSETEKVGDAVRRLTGKNGVDIVIDNVGSADTVKLAIDSLRAAGRLVMVGETPDNLPLSTFRLCFSEFEVLGSRSGSRQDTVEAIDAVARGIVDPFISDTFPLDEINEAFERVKQRKVMGRAVVTM